VICSVLTLFQYQKVECKTHLFFALFALCKFVFEGFAIIIYFNKLSSETPRASAIFFTVSMVGFGVAPASILAIV